MSALKKIANWLDPVRTTDAANTNDTVDYLNETVNDLVQKLSYCAATNVHLRHQVGALRSSLIAARPYVMGSYDDTLADFEALSVRSKKRSVVGAVLEAVKMDLQIIANALEINTEATPVSE